MCLSVCKFVSVHARVFVCVSLSVCLSLSLPLSLALALSLSLVKLKSAVKSQSWSWLFVMPTLESGVGYLKNQLQLSGVVAGFQNSTPESGVGVITF